MAVRLRPRPSPALPTRPRNASQHVSYRELETDSDSDSSASSIDSDPGPDIVPASRRSLPSVSVNLSFPSVSKSKSNQNFAQGPAKNCQVQINVPSTRRNRAAECRKGTLGKSRRKPREMKKSKEKASGTEKHEFDISELGGKVPPWQTLPYEILFQIFQYASHPLWDDAFNPTPSITWLLRSALVCRAFAEPALSALYFAPPLCPPFRAVGLLQRLVLQNDDSYLNYRAKVKYLDLEAKYALFRKFDGKDPINLAELVALTPQVRGIGIHSISDQARWHKASVYKGGHGKKSPYVSSFFHSLNQNGIKLSEWIWNDSLAGSEDLASQIPAVHQSPAFQALRKLTLNNFGIKEKSSLPTEILFNAAGALPDLRHLSLKNTPILDGESLNWLPNNLESLEVINCSNLTSPDFTPFLASHGDNMRELILDHNRSLDLSFLEDLARNCPRLERLHMDLRFYNSYYTFQNSDPRFAALLEPEDMPTWPTTLQRLELFQLRKWLTPAAEAFFSSLVDSAASLPDLRYIDIKASLDESSWRDRIAFRDTWIRRLQQVFRRQCTPPIPFVQPHLKANSWSNRSAVPNQTSAGDIRSGSDSDTPLTTQRRSRRIKARPIVEASSSTSSSPPRKRLRRKAGSDYTSSSDEQSMPEDQSKTPHVQGMCDFVHVVIDNLRPTEAHLDESNFLDDEISGDEDWNGDGGTRGEEDYAW